MSYHRRSLVCVLVSCATFAGAPVAAALAAPPPTFSTTSLTASPTGIVGTRRVAVCDLNGDGLADLAVASFGPGGGAAGALTELDGLGDGAFGAPVVLDTSPEPTSVACGDLAGHGRNDLAATFGVGANLLRLFLRAAPGTSPPFTTEDHPDSLAPYAAVLVDLNNDHRLDVAVAHRLNVQPDTAFYSGVNRAVLGQAGLIDAGVTSNHVDIAAGDLDGDAYPDLALADLDTGDISLRRGPGCACTTGISTIDLGSVGQVLGVAIGDLNDDRHPDIAVATASNDAIVVPTDGTVDGDGRANIGTPIHVPIGFAQGAVAIGDVNGDGIPDIVARAATLPLVAVATGSGSGSFDPPVTFPVGDPGPASTLQVGVTVADVNGDGLADVITADGAAGTVTVLRSTAPHAVIQVVPTVSGDPRFTLDASRTTSGVTIASYAWDRTGTGVFDATCPGSAPSIFTPLSPTTTAVQMRATDTLGRFTTTSVPVHVLALRGARRTTLGGAFQSTVAGFACGSTTGGGARCATTVDSGQVHAVAVRGCFTEGTVGGMNGAFVPATGAVHQPRTRHGAVVVSTVFAGHAIADALGQRKAWVTSSPVIVNGLYIEPKTSQVVDPGVCNGLLKACLGGTQYLAPEFMITEYQDFSSIWSPSADVSVLGIGGDPKLHGLLARHATIDEPVGLSAGAPPLPPMVLPDVSGLGVKVGGLALTGPARVQISNSEVQISLRIVVPLLAGLGGGAATADVTLVADATGGVRLNNLRFVIDRALLGFVTLNGVTVTYSRATDTWQGAGSADFVGGAGVGASLRIIHGRFQGASLSFTLPDPGVPVVPFPPVFLEGGSASIDGFVSPPLVLQGGAVFNVGGKFSTPFGVARFAQVDGSVTLTFADPWSVAADGAVSVVGIPVGSGHAEFRSDGYVTMNAQAGYDFLGIVHGRGSLTGTVWGSQANVLIDGNVSFGPFIDLGGQAVVSSIGMGACGEVVIKNPLHDVHLHPGIGLLWGELPTVLPGSCGVGRWTVDPPKATAHGGRVASAAAVGAGEAFVVPAGGLAIRATGTLGTPTLTITDPAGVATTTRPTSIVQTDRLIAYSLSSSHQTAMLIGAGSRSSTWHVRIDGVSAGSVRLERSVLLPDPSVQATIAGSRWARTLHYRARSIPGQRITFYEQTRHGLVALGSTSRSQGTIPFVPADDIAGSRAVVAVVTQDGAERARMRVTRYSAPGPFVPAAPGGLGARRVAAGLLVRWRPTRGAARYSVRLETGDGAVIGLTTASAATSATLAVSPEQGGSLIVAALRANGRGGRQSRLVVRPRPGAIGPATAVPLLTGVAPSRPVAGRPLVVRFVLADAARVTLAVQVGRGTTVVRRLSAQSGLVELGWSGLLAGKRPAASRVVLLVTVGSPDGTVVTERIALTLG